MNGDAKEKGTEHKKHKRHKKESFFLVPLVLLVFRPLFSYWSLVILKSPFIAP